MEVAASIVGLLAVGAKIYTYLEEFVSSCADAPTVAQITCDEVRDFRYALRRLKPYVDQSSKITPLGAAATDVNQLSLTLASCVVTFSRLEKTLDGLLPRTEMDTICRLRWAMAGGSISQLVTRLQQHKLTLTLLLTIWISESSAQTEQCLAHLNDVMTQITTPKQRPQPLSVLTMPIYEELSNDADLTIIATNSRATPTNVDSSSTVATNWHSLPKPTFESDLYSSKPYRAIKRVGSSAMSLASSQKRGTQWSVFSGGSNTSVFSLPYTVFELSGTTIAQKPDISTMPLPGRTNQVYNPWWYTSNGTLSPTSRQTAPSANRLRRSPSGSKVSLLDAVERGDMGAAACALVMGDDIDSRGSNGKTAFHLATKANNKQIVEMLLDRGGRIDIRDFEGKTGLHLAVMGQHGGMIDMLLDRGAEIEAKDNGGSTPLHLGASSGGESIVRLLLDRGAEVNAKNNKDRSPLHLGVSSGGESIVRLLLDRGAEVNAKNNKDRTPLHLGITHYGGSLVRLLLDRGAEAEAKDNGGSTPLHLGVSTGGESIVHLLLDRGSEVNAKDNKDRIPLHLGASHHRRSLSRLLLDRGAEVTAKDNDGSTPLHLSASSRHYSSYDISRFLLDRGADINAKDSRGRTPLHHVSASTDSPNYGLVRLLLDRGAGIDAKDNDGKTALDLAASSMGCHGRLIARMLLEEPTKMTGTATGGSLSQGSTGQDQ